MTVSEVGALAGHRAWIACLAWSPDGTRLACGQDVHLGVDRAPIRIWPVAKAVASIHDVAALKSATGLVLEPGAKHPSVPRASRGS